MTAPVPKKRAETAVVAIIVDRRKRVLLTRRTRQPMAGMWHMAGGAVEFGETLEAALKRELDEELGIAVTIKDPLPAAVASTVYPSVDRHVVALYYRADIASGVPRALDGSADAVGWFNVRLVRTLCAKGLLLDSCRSALERALGWKLL